MLYLQFDESQTKAFYNNANQLRKRKVGPEVQITHFEIILHSFQSIICLIVQTLMQIPNA